MRVLGISGSLRRDSHNTTLLRAARELVEEQGAEFELFDGLKAIPPYDEDADVEPAPRAVAALRAQIAAADAVLIATPEYNASVPGVLKNALDWASRPVKGNVLQGKPAAVIGASTGLFGAIGAEVVDRELPVMQAHMQFDEYGNVREESLRDQLAEHVAALVAAVPEKACATV